MELVKNPTASKFYEKVKEASEVEICVPFIKQKTLSEIFDINPNIKLTLITNMNSGSFKSGASDLDAIRHIHDKNMEVYNNQKLHAKIYVFDSVSALVSSANLTPSGMNKNYEYGVYFEEQPYIKNLLEDLENLKNNEITSLVDAKILDEIEIILENLGPLDIKFDSEDYSITKDGVNKLKPRMTSWEKAVFDCIEDLNSVHFNLTQVYQYKHLLKKKFQLNNTIESSIRQKLQLLRDKGLVKFYGNGQYKRLWETK